MQLYRLGGDFLRKLAAQPIDVGTKKIPTGKGGDEQSKLLLVLCFID
jgi:hypothetical protein